MRVLVVEDARPMAEALAKGLREQGYAVDVAGDGETAIEQAEINQYDAIVLDVMLPRRVGEFFRLNRVEAISDGDIANHD